MNSGNVSTNFDTFPEQISPMIDDDICPGFAIIIRLGDLAIQIAIQHVAFRELDRLLNSIVPGENLTPIIHSIRKRQFRNHINSFPPPPGGIAR